MMPPRNILSRRKKAILAFSVAFLFGLPVLAAIVSERHYYEIPHDGETELIAHLNIALGDVRVGKADAGYLFQGEVELESENLKPKFHFESRNGRAELSLDLDGGERGKRSIGLAGLSSARSSQWLLMFGDAVPTDLMMKMGLTSGTLELGGIPLRRLLMDCGASRTRLTFSEPNPITMETLEIKAGASTFTARGLGNSRAQHMSFDGGAGRFYLDFSGSALPAAGHADISVGMAAVTIVLPDNAPIALHVSDSWLTRVETPVGYTKMSGGAWHSPHVRDERNAFQINVRAGVGTVKFHRASEAPSEE